MDQNWLLLCFFLFFQYLSFSLSLCLPHEAHSLHQFNNSFTIDPSNFCDDIHQPKSTTWKLETDCCSWLGITCHPISGHVIHLDLSCSGLHGKIHPNSTLFHLYHLQSLNLAHNDLSHSHFSSNFGAFPALTHLNLSSSSIQGEIPSPISHLSKLVSLDLSGNYYPSLKWKDSTWKKLLQNTTALRELVLNNTNMSSISISSLNLSSTLATLSLKGTSLRGNLTNHILCSPNLQHLYLSQYYEGELPELSCRCSGASLRVLDLSYCQFKGSIPPSFSNLTHLTSLDLSDNNLNGSIPSSLLTLPHLTFLYLYYNNLNGQIPNVFHHSNKFQEIDLSDNNIGGELPLSLPNLQNLIFLDLSSNQLSGQIPNVFAELTKLEFLFLFQNNIRGQIPSSLFSLMQLSSLYVSDNKLQGPLPNKITGLSNLTSLDLRSNLLNGTIPSWCLSLPSLMQLDLSHNHFTGHVSAISSYSLKYLYLDDNNLQGNIPTSIFNLINLADLDLSSNNFSGPVNFPLFSKLQNLERLSLSYNNHLSLSFKSNANYSFSMLQSLGLSSISLTEFPKSSGKLSSLTDVDLSNNKLGGKVPSWLLEIDSLRFLNLSQNMFTSLMDHFSTNDKLGYIDLSFNALTSAVSSIVCNTSSIGVLNLSNNKLMSLIPQCFVNLSSLRVLDLQMNKLFGSLPDFFPRKSNISVLNLSGNQLQGPLPTSLSNCTQLQVLNLGNNQIEDTFPHWLHNLSNLEVLILRENKFHGPIINLENKHMFSNVIIFDISGNNFNGLLPVTYIEHFKAMMNSTRMESSLEYMGYMYFIPGPYHFYELGFYDSIVTTMKGINLMFTRIPKILTTIDLSRNKFEGEIPNVLGELHALKGLNLSHNKLIGPIPHAMGNLKNLEWLDLSSNMLIGGIPLEFTSLNFLEVLNLSYNHLVGEIPQGKQFSTFSSDSYRGNLGLCGSPVLIQCNLSPKQSSPPSNTIWSEHKLGFGWEPVAIGYGCGMVFGIGLGCCVLLTGKPQWLVMIIGGGQHKKSKRRARVMTSRRILN